MNNEKSAQVLNFLCPKCNNNIFPSYIDFAKDIAICSVCDNVLKITFENDGFTNLYDLWRNKNG